MTLNKSTMPAEKRNVGYKPRLSAAIDFDWKLKNFYDRMFVYLLIVSLVLRTIWLDCPQNSLIFDEKYYVNVARIILGLPHDPDVYAGAPPGEDPNKEHPPLAKLIIALSMRILGDNAWGWRLPSIIFGMASIFIFYVLMKRVSKSPKLALLASFFYSFDNLVFIHSRIATLDIFVLAFMLLGFYWYSLNRMDLSALALALSTLSKVGGLYGFATIVAYHFVCGLYAGSQLANRKGDKKARIRRKIQSRLLWREKLRWFERFTTVYALSSLIILFVLDYFWAGYKNPLDHLIHIYRYTLALTRPEPVGIESLPWQWLQNEVKIPYLTVNVIEYPSGKVIGEMVAFVGAMNPLIIYLCLPAIAYVAYNYYKKADDTTLFILAWFCFTYLPFYPLSVISHRISYIFYFLNTVPSVCAAISFTLLHRNSPKTVIALYLIAVLIGFATLFPFKRIP